MVGRSLLHYQIIEKIGEGGMGVVYKARDTHLDRFVAIKTLPADRMADAERKRRFVQEAKAASALNHPNIVTIYDITSEQDVDFIAMEYIAGKSIEQMIPRQGMRLTDALNYAVQIADGLSQAHQATIIHRDLKPGNIMVGEGGRVKILDFGLAKLTGPAEISEDESTRTLRDATEDGAIVGTAAYMSPEQAEGRPLDARTDIFSFGIVLYEMLSGRKPFQGASRIATVSAILKESPKPLSGFVPEIPHELERLVERCLRKDPERRWQSMRDLRVALLDLKEESDSGALAQVHRKERPATKRWPLAAAVVAAITLTISAAVWWMSRTAVNQEKEVSVVPLTAQPGDERDPTFSPDGNQVAFAWGPEGGTPDIYVKLIGPGQPIRLTNTPDDERMPQWSPDGRWIAFPRSGPTGRKVVVIPALGGPERVIAQDRGGGGTYTSWSADSKWVAYTPSGGSGLYLAPLNGGEKKFVIGPLQGTYPVISGILSPNSRNLALVCRIGQYGPLYVAPLSTNYKAEGEPKALTPADWSVISPAWTADGREILFIRSSGNANAGSDTVMYRVAITGGTPRRVDFAGDNPWFLGVAPRGNRMAFTRLHRDINIHRIELDADGAIRKPGQVIASSSRRDEAASYSPDGTRIAFSSNRGGSLEIWTARADGENAAQLTTSTGMGSTGPQWSPDGSKIAYSSSGIFVIPASGGAAQALTTDPARGIWPTWSRDGRWIYFQRSRDDDQASISNIWKVASTGGPATQVTRGGGNLAMESPDRKWLYVAAPAGVLRRMPLEGGEETECVRDLFSFRSASNLFFVTTKGVYYLGQAAGQQGALIRFVGHEGGEPKTLGNISRPPSIGLSLSPDGRSLLYSQYDQSAAELMLVENFH